LWQLAEKHTPDQSVAAYTQGIMDLGATVCLRSRANCQVCPLMKRCQALATDRVTELPTKKKSAPKPVRQARFFIVSLPDQQILLEQRPQSGIWGGLWNPPERPTQTSTESFLQSQGIHVNDVLRQRDGAPFRHTFSHFHLDIQPTYISLKRQPNMLQEGEQRWVSLTRLRDSDEAIGLSAAALRLLKEH
jgi:A/G-specific adenine glycosylase